MEEIVKAVKEKNDIVAGKEDDPDEPRDEAPAVTFEQAEATPRLLDNFSSGRRTSVAWRNFRKWSWNVQRELRREVVGGLVQKSVLDFSALATEPRAACNLDHDEDD
jgi:hypothetical protein